MWPVVMIRLLNPGLMDQVMWLGGWNEVYVGRHIPVKVVCSTWHNMDSSKTAIMHKLMLHAHKCLLLMWVTVLIAEMNEVYHESLTERLCNGLGLHPYPGRCSVQIWGLYAPMGSTAHVRWTMPTVMHIHMFILNTHTNKTTNYNTVL